MRASDKGKGLIRKHEGLRLYAYRDMVGKLTIGYGHTKNVRSGQAITNKQAEDLLDEDLHAAEVCLNSLGVNFRQEQFDALCSWIFNLGEGNFMASTLLRKIKKDAPDEEITDEIVRWVYAGGKPATGLMLRRIDEANMFLGRKRYYLDDKKIKKR